MHAINASIFHIPPTPTQIAASSCTVAPEIPAKRAAYLHSLDAKIANPCTTQIYHDRIEFHIRVTRGPSPASSTSRVLNAKHGWMIAAQGYLFAPSLNFGEPVIETYFAVAVSATWPDSVRKGRMEESISLSSCPTNRATDQTGPDETGLDGTGVRMPGKL
ncbi:hypothetical protein POX_h09627 [Penicillium oxalicum]|uniref:hypothetical protein n=1 Tax=Penicillium oxalicum TaxID=69781 RepID=UPI0020B8A21F|nr:hypothetical protein POX_h09627 [Penicillium oxalicum]KAI2785865.1 hypothetical protein POX_h09627 [Penicillium oxalicum]